MWFPGYMNRVFLSLLTLPVLVLSVLLFFVSSKYNFVSVLRRELHTLVVLDEEGPLPATTTIRLVHRQHHQPRRA